MSSSAFLAEKFELLRGNPPYPWQRKLFAQMVSGEWPQLVDMPTGAGKTAVLWIWWLALAWSKQQGTNGIPIRLAWVVNRRVVVDQVTEEVNELRTKWRELGFENLLEIPAASTLRGQLADNGEWRHNPTKPAVIVGTVDMIGSRLLFRGYRSGPYWRPIESGLLGVDTLIVNDEAHLSPAFSELVQALEEMKPAQHITGKSFRYMLLSATQDDKHAGRFRHDPNEDAAESIRFKQAWAAGKSLELCEAANGAALKSQLWNLTTQQPAPRTIVFIEKPPEALEFYKRLTKNGFETALMTGTMRGKERDELAEINATFQRFLARDPGEGSVFLVATSAAEVGVNLTCERMITELREADHLIQRFGRLNRFGVDGSGQPIQGKAFVVYVEPKKDSQARLKATLDYLRTLNGNISPCALWNCRPPEGALSEKPKLARLEPWRIESWAQTSYQDRDVTRVEPWVRGQEKDPPQTEVAWRADLECLREWEVPAKQIEKVLDAFPVLPKEKLQEPSDRVFQKLGEIAGKLNGASDWILIVQPDQSVRWAQISNLRKEDIQYCLVLLAEHIGQLEQHGMFEPELGDEQEKDVSTDGENRVRILIKNGEGGYRGEPFHAPAPNDANAVRKFAQSHDFRAPVMIRNPKAEDNPEMLLYLTKRTVRSGAKLEEIPLDKHQTDMADWARKLAGTAGLNEFADGYFRAGRVHDEGKRHDRWQKAMGAKHPPAAKTVAAANLTLLNGYRHEFKSLVDAAESGQASDLMLHLIATHHASGRPFFDADAYDPLPDKPKCERVAREAEQRFARLQHEFGPWGLAYLEALFKRADGLASAQEGDGASE